MSESLTKAQWQEKKKYGSKKEQRAAVSVQTARIIEKLLDRSRGLANSRYETPNHVLSVAHHFEGATEDKNFAELTEDSEHFHSGSDSKTLQIAMQESKTKPFLRKEKIEKTAVITNIHEKDNYGDVASNTKRELVIDATGKQKPVEYTRDIYYNSTGKHDLEHTTKPEAEAVVAEAADALYSIKKSIDQAEAEQVRRAA